ncbi:MAG: hypothetical protein AAF401_01515 [Pseudomonadota bacterium]
MSDLQEKFQERLARRNQQPAEFRSTGKARPPKVRQKQPMGLFILAIFWGIFAGAFAGWVFYVKPALSDFKREQVTEFSPISDFVMIGVVQASALALMIFLVVRIVFRRFGPAFNALIGGFILGAMIGALGAGLALEAM